MDEDDFYDYEDVPAFPTPDPVSSSSSTRPIEGMDNPFVASAMHVPVHVSIGHRSARTFDVYWRYLSIRYMRYRRVIHLLFWSLIVLMAGICFMPGLYSFMTPYTDAELKSKAEAPGAGHLVEEILERLTLPGEGVGVRQFTQPSDIAYNDMVFDPCTPLLMNEITSGTISVKDGTVADGYDHLVIDLDDVRAFNERLIADHFGPPSGETVALMPKLWDLDVEGEFNPCFMTARMPNGVFLSMVNPTIVNAFETDDLYREVVEVPVLPAEHDIFPFWQRTVTLFRVVVLHFIQWPSGKQRTLEVGIPIDDPKRVEMSYSLQLWQELLESSGSLHDVVLYQADIEDEVYDVAEALVVDSFVQEEEEPADPEMATLVDGVVVKEFTADEWDLYVEGEEDVESIAEATDPADDLDYLFTDP